MKVRILATSLFAFLAPGLCLAQSASQPPPKPGSVNITTRAPEPDKWDSQRSANGLQRVFRCKPLACPDPQTVTFILSKSPTHNPDPKALKKFAEVDLPKSIRAMGAAREVLSDGADKIETLSSKTATLKGYPSVVNESKFSQGKKSTFVEIAIIFAGPVMIRVTSLSPGQALAQKALTQFVDVMRIEMGAPLPAPSPQPPQGLQSL